MPRYWRYVVGALGGLAVGVIARGTVGLIIGVIVTLTIIVVIESRARRARGR